jgi:alpha-tubulin suppressor-like RCC1 family protein
MKKARNCVWALLFILAAWFAASPAYADGGYFSRQAVAVSADQRAIIIKNGSDISMTFSTGYTGEGEDFGWIIPTPVPPAVEDVSEAGENGEAAFQILDGYTAPQIIVSSGCFPAETEVLTADGPRAIEGVAPGTQVYACDLSPGRWVLSRVLKQRSFQWEGDMITLRAGSVSVEATGNHPFYVVRGDRLTSRPVSQEISNEDQETSGPGRWVEARDLQEGDVLKTMSGGDLILTGLSSRKEKAEVYYLEVEGFHNYTVHREGILVHNGGYGEEAKTGKGSESVSAVTVYGRVVLRHYEVSIVGAAGSSALLGWLAENGYQVNTAARDILDAYIARNWAFAAVKLNPSEKRHYENEFLPPLTIEYQHDRLVFPLRISSVSTAETVRITLYVIAESTVSSSNLPTKTLLFREPIADSEDPERFVEEGIRLAAGSQGRGMVVLWKGECPESVELRGALEGLSANPPPKRMSIFLTRLDTRIDPVAMTQDIELALDPAPRRFSQVVLNSALPGGHGTPQRLPGLSGVVAIAASDRHTIALKDDGTVWTWDWIGEGADSRYTPVQISGLSGVVAVEAGGAHTAALKEDGTVWSWGWNRRSQLGDGTTETRSRPVQAKGISGVVAIGAGGSHTLALKSDGTVWSWGWGSYGQLGNGGTANRSIPVQVEGLSGVTAIAAGGSHSLAVTNDGAVWAWGRNSYGELGDRSKKDSLLPEQIDGINDAIAVSSNSFHSVALKKDGTIWSWGWNEDGQLGDGGTENRTVPAEIGGLSGVVAVVTEFNHTVALKHDGTVWAWGKNDKGQLGDESRADSFGPVQVSGLSGVVEIAVGGSHTAALKDDGTVWAWGLYW